MPIDPGFVADCPYGPDGQLLDSIVAVDRDASTIVATMATRADLPLTRDQRAHPERHPHHVSGALMIHATGILGFAHAYFVLDLRHADGWIGYGTHIHAARFVAWAGSARRCSSHVRRPRCGGSRARSSRATRSGSSRTAI